MTEVLRSPSVFTDSIPHSKEKDLQDGGNWNAHAGENWVVQKYGGTSVGKKAGDICDIIANWLKSSRVAVVLSARSSSTKSEGTTSRLLRAAKEAESSIDKGYVPIIQVIEDDHVAAATNTIANPDILNTYIQEVRFECASLIKILELSQHLEEVSSRAEDRIIAAGEKLACKYMTALLIDRGVPAQYIDLSDIVKKYGLNTASDDFYTSLAFAFGTTLANCGDKVPIITGYFGPIPGGLLKFVGRGYTDLCAALVAVGVKASELQIWKEVDGIFTADPRKVPTARLIPSVTPAEASELTFFGSEVIHPFTMSQVISARIPIRIKNVMNPSGSGTIIYPDPEEVAHSNSHSSNLFRTRSSSDLDRAYGSHSSSSSNGSSSVFSGARIMTNGITSNGCNSMVPKRPTAVTIKHGIVVLNVHSNRQRTRAHGFLASIFTILDRWHLSVDLIASSEVHVSMALHSERGLLTSMQTAPPTPSSSGILQPLQQQQQQQQVEELTIEDDRLRGAVTDLAMLGNVDLAHDMAIVSLVGRQLRNMMGISGRFFSVLGDAGVNIEMISQGASEINISCVIWAIDADRALNTLHTNLFTFSEES